MTSVPENAAFSAHAPLPLTKKIALRQIMKPADLSRIILTLLTLAIAHSTQAHAELLLGQATTDITPKLPVALSGQMNTRIARTVESPVTASVVVLEKIAELAR